MSPLKFRSLWTFIGYSLVVLVIVLSLMPAPHLPIHFRWSDKFYHVLAYGALMLWFAQLHPKSRYVWLAGGFVFLGILMEILQSQLTTRSGEISDAVANSLGALLSWGLALKGMNVLLHRFENRYLKSGNED